MKFEITGEPIDAEARYFLLTHKTKNAEFITPYWRKKQIQNAKQNPKNNNHERHKN